MKFGNFREKPYTRKMDFMGIDRSEQLDTYNTRPLPLLLVSSPLLVAYLSMYSEKSWKHPYMELCKRLSLSSPNAKQSKKVEILTKRFSPFFAKKQVMNNP
ncbi:hypothetical protein T12_16015 [Trichinella patagoniensis]|uniref:Uncharacterized protein n=1 Tax=Trichinella patagoniensis TaxID=990121 RepID=A0A0V0Z921_9BILA|nr:hypothetical protein T12_16015 [Trichinella patagoniensis]